MGRYTYTATGDLGVQRTAMLSNELHQRPAVGKSLRRGRELPPLDFAYGVRQLTDEHGVAQCLRWNTHDDGYSKYRLRNFVKCNKGAVKSGAHTSKEFRDFATSAPLDKYAFSVKHTPRHKVKDTFPDDYIFGARMRPSTPIADVLSHRYGNDWQEAALRRNRFLHAAPPIAPWDTVSSALAMLPGENEELSKCKKMLEEEERKRSHWDKVVPRICSNLNAANLPGTAVNSNDNAVQDAALLDPSTLEADDE